MNAKTPQKTEMKDGETEETAVLSAKISALEFDLGKSQDRLKKMGVKYRSLENELKVSNNKLGDTQRANIMLQARMQAREVEFGHLRIAANTSGTIAMVAGIGLLIALLMLL